MIPELGHFALILALLLSALQAFFGIAGPALGRDRWVAVVTPTVAGQFVMVCTAFACLIASFVTLDFSVLYVAQNANSALPLIYRVAAVWGAHEGSLLLWIFLLACWTVAVAIGASRLPKRFAARVLGVLGIISFAFLLFALATSNPFLRLIPAAADGRDLNPLLQDPALAIHPPMLYTGYVGFSVAFAFACAAMLEGKMDQVWARWTRPWTTVAWGFLSMGIALGSWWAYYELGWGGYWFWDSVENASFMPWLVGTALIHSLAVTDKRGLFKSWTLLLAILAFSLSLLGTFLVRSGSIVSVHAFAADPGRGMFILAFLVIIVGGALALYAWRAPLLKSQAGFEIISRESFLLFNNILLVVATAVVFGGTLAPLIAEALGLPTLSVGTPYFNPSFLTPIIPLIALLPLGIQAGWKKGRLSEHARRLLVWLAISVALSIAVIVGFFGRSLVLTPVGYALAFWIVLSSLADPIDRIRRKLSLSRGVIGMTVAHIAMAMFIIGITSVESYTQERDIAVGPGETVNLGNYGFRFDKIENVEGPNYEGVRGYFTVTHEGRQILNLTPEKRLYWVQRQGLTEAGIGSFWGTNIFLALGDDLGAGKWSVRLQVRPLVNYVWIAAFIMALGGGIAASDRRYRNAKQQATEDVGVTDGALQGRPG
ncbi:MAG: heme lyase CcmF/NrfE family subunit [Gammaproteobacteria bacterium]